MPMTQTLAAIKDLTPKMQADSVPSKYVPSEQVRKDLTPKMQALYRYRYADADGAIYSYIQMQM